MKIRKVLCPVDFSEGSKLALDNAADFAKTQKAELLLLHVIEPFVLPIEYGMSSIPRVELDEEAKKGAQEGLRKLADAHLQGLRADALIEFGRAAEAIVSTAQKKGCDLIVISTHGRKGLSRFFIGSTAERVVRLAHCPVLIVRGETDPARS